MHRVSDRDVQWYRSKVDGVFKLVMALLALSCLLVLIASLRSGDTTEIIIAVITCAFVGGLVLLFVFPVRYGIAQDELIIRFGVVRKRFRLDAIRDVRPERNMIASPAMSMDRLAIRTGRGSLPDVLISPADREGFLEALAERAGLERRGDHLTRIAD